jgi:hypothetical protein
MYSITRAPILIRRSRIVVNSQPASGLVRGIAARTPYQPERGRVEDEPYLIGRRAVTRHAIRRQLGLVQLDRVLHLPALAVHVLVKVLRGARERGDDIAASRRIPISPATGCSEHSSPATTWRGRFQLVAWYMKLANARSLASRLIA